MGTHLFGSPYLGGRRRVSRNIICWRHLPTRINNWLYAFMTILLKVLINGVTNMG